MWRQKTSYLILLFLLPGLGGCAQPDVPADGQIVGIHGESSNISAGDSVSSSNNNPVYAPGQVPPNTQPPRGNDGPNFGFFSEMGKNAESDPLRDREVRESMQRIQMAAEHYAADHGTDKYPVLMDDEFKSYFPGGRDGSVPAPMGPVNVFTGVNEFPSVGSMPSVQAVRSGQRFRMNRGQIKYCPLLSGKGYAIIGGASDGMVLLDEKNPGQVLVLSNLED